MKLAVLFSGGKDSCYSAYLLKQQGHELACLISVFSENIDSYMFHTPSIEQVKKQSEAMNLPLIIQETKGKKEVELKDLEKAIKTAIKEYKIRGIITGAVRSDYQSSRIQKIADKLKLKCFNPLWQKDEIQYLNELIKNNFKIIITAVGAYPLDEEWLGKEINNSFITDIKELNNKHKINPIGEGGEFETFVLSCPLFKRQLKIVDKKITGKGNSWRMDIEVI